MKNIVDLLLSIDAKEVKMPTGNHKMFCKKIGEELDFEIQAIDPQKVAEIQEEAIGISKGEVSKIDTYALKVDTIGEGCSLFKNKDIQSHFGALNYRELIKTLLTNGEMDSLKGAIDELNNVKEEKETTKEIKN